MENQNPNNKELILLKIQTKEGTSFNDRVRGVTSFNDKGVFDVLPKHENFISIIKDRIIIYLESGKNEEIKIDNGVMRVIKNEVHVFLGLT